MKLLHMNTKFYKHLCNAVYIYRHLIQYSVNITVQNIS